MLCCAVQSAFRVLDARKHSSMAGLVLCTYIYCVQVWVINDTSMGDMAVRWCVIGQWLNMALLPRHPNDDV